MGEVIPRSLTCCNPTFFDRLMAVAEVFTGAGVHRKTTHWTSLRHLPQESSTHWQSVLAAAQYSSGKLYWIFMKVTSCASAPRLNAAYAVFFGAPFYSLSFLLRGGMRPTMFKHILLAV